MTTTLLVNVIIFDILSLSLTSISILLLAKYNHIMIITFQISLAGDWSRRNLEASPYFEPLITASYKPER